MQQKGYTCNCYYYYYYYYYYILWGFKQTNSVMTTHNNSHEMVKVYDIVQIAFQDYFYRFLYLSWTFSTHHIQIIIFKGTSIISIYLSISFVEKNRFSYLYYVLQFFF